MGENMTRETIVQIDDVRGQLPPHIVDELESPEDDDEFTVHRLEDGTILIHIKTPEAEGTCWRSDENIPLS